ALVAKLACGDRIDQPRGRFARALLVGVLKQDAEFVTADAGDDIALADAALQQPSDLDQSVVTGAMAEGVVDRFQSIEVDEQHRGPGVVAARPRARPLELANEP